MAACRRQIVFASAQGATALRAEGCGIAPWAMNIKSALRDWLSVSYVTQYPVPPIFSFPLEGKCHVVAKGCTGQSNDVLLYRYPDRQSAASLATSWSSPPFKQVALVLISAVVKAFS